jgi:iron complex transport system permease protein
MRLKMNRKNYGKIILLMFILLILLIAVFSTMGSANIKVVDTVRIILSKFPVLGDHIDTSDISDSSKIIILNIRLPRVLLGVIVGAALSISGAAFQGIFKNPMADPYIIGISSGAALGAAISIVAKIDFSLLGMSSVSIGAFIGAIAAAFLVYFISRVKNKIPVDNLLLSGVAVGQFFTAVMSFIMVINSKDMSKIIFWTLGSFSGKGWEPFLKTSPPVIIFMIILTFFAKDLNIILTGEEAAQSLGVEVEKTKIYILVICAFITSSVVSVCGIIGFVGLIIPHIVRLIVGPDHRILLPSSALVGGMFMIFADTVARTVISPTEIPVGIITAMFGGPFFIYLLRKRKKTV